MHVSQTRDLLSGLLVVEIGCSLRAAFCGKLLADCGAEVVKIEPMDMSAQTHEGERLWLDAGKRSVMLDWRAAPAVEVLTRLLVRSDVLIEDQPPGALAARGLSPERLRADNPRLVHTSITDFGSDGPWMQRPATDLIISALSGMAALNGLDGRAPLREPGSQTYLLAALFGFIGTLTALINRDVTGRGQHVEVAALEAVASALTPYFLRASYQGTPQRRRKPGEDTLMRCRDGWLSLIPYSDRTWEALIALYGLKVNPNDPYFATEQQRRANIAQIREALSPVFAQRTRRELFEQLSPLRVLCGMVMRPDELPNDLHLTERGSFIRHSPTNGSPAGTLPGPGFRVAGDRPVASPLTALPEPGVDLNVALSHIGMTPKQAGEEERP
jgi:crotonobetainyl-CoA:carnitine CoA-transferase CaiB-like acyl-CoA transferase